MAKRVPSKKKKKFAWGGARTGAGRPKSPDSGVPHKPRPVVTKKTKVELTYLLAPEVAHAIIKKKSSALAAELVVKNAVIDANAHWKFSISKWELVTNGIGARIVVRGAGAHDTDVLSCAAQGFGVRVARRLNAALGRTGQVFADRYAVTVL